MEENRNRWVIWRYSSKLSESACPSFYLSSNIDHWHLLNICNYLIHKRLRNLNIYYFFNKSKYWCQFIKLAALACKVNNSERIWCHSIYIASHCFHVVLSWKKWTKFSKATRECLLKIYFYYNKFILSNFTQKKSVHIVFECLYIGKINQCQILRK